MNNIIDKIADFLIGTYNAIVNVGKDKLLHFSVSAVLTSVFNLFLPFWGLFFVMSLIFIAKEIYDFYNCGDPDHKDIIADYIGFIVGVI